MTAAALRIALLLPILLVGCDRASPPAPKQKLAAAQAALKIPDPPRRPSPGGSPEPPERLPPVRTCAERVGAASGVDGLAGQVDGALVRGGDGLRALRKSWGDALIVVRGGDFSGADLRSARLHNICFVETNFRGSDWRGADAPGIGLFHSDLTGARLAGARLPGVTIGNPQLAGVDASGANLSDGRLYGNALGSWERLRLDGADLRRFHFECGRTQENQCVSDAGGRQISFRGADLRSARVDTYYGRTDWTRARLSWTTVSLRQLYGIAQARFDGPIIVREGRASASLSPAEYRWLRRHLPKPGGAEPPIAGERPRWMKAGAVALFAAPPIELGTAARASPLYRRLLPVLIEGATSVLLVEVRRNGAVAVDGNAIGGNGHLCSLAAPDLRFDRASGWFVAKARPIDGIRRPPDRPLKIVAFTGESADVYENGHPWGEKDRDFIDFGQCGARAGFARMTRVPVSAAEARRIYRNWNGV